MTTTCGNCRFWADADFENICCNGTSEHCCDYTSHEQTCDKWESKNNE